VQTGGGTIARGGDRSSEHAGAREKHLALDQASGCEIEQTFSVAAATLCPPEPLSGGRRKGRLCNPYKPFGLRDGLPAKRGRQIALKGPRKYHRDSQCAPHTWTTDRLSVRSYSVTTGGPR
jgi:hypothetical protein